MIINKKEDNFNIQGSPPPLELLILACGHVFNRKQVGNFQSGKPA